ncbi:MAG TPA: tetratricopeptide repeat protein [Thermoanaerobaculia bacterium]|nr:tetratricopeptide repeat protein [Thermoanaerobaculia bacterium]
MHLDDFLLLRYAARELNPAQCAEVEEHVASCFSCGRRLDEIARLDADLRELAREGALDQPAGARELPAGDPFRERPPISERPPRTRRARLATFVARAAEEASELRDRLLAAHSAHLPDLLAEIPLEEPGARYGVLYALQEAGRRIASGPVTTLRFAEAVLARVRQASPAERDDTEAEDAVPLLLLVGQSHLLAGQACNWTREFERAKTHLQIAYRAFAASGGDEVGLAIVEHVEAQRRFLLDRGAEALVLARRAKSSFEMLGLEELSAKADVAVGSALAKLGREEEAVPLLSGAVRLFERRHAWSNYVGTLNALATCLQNLDRLDEARREYARALRALSRDPDGSLLAATRYGLAEVLFAAGRFREAAASFSRTSRLYDELGLAANSLTSSLWEIESRARAGEVARAIHRLELFEKRVSQLGALDPRVTREIHSALSGTNPDLSRLTDLRRQAQEIVRERLSQASA